MNTRKKNFEAPVVTRLGTVAELTLATGGDIVSDVLIGDPINGFS